MSSTVASEALQGKPGTQSYGSDQIQVLEGLDPVREETWNVYWKHWTKRAASSAGYASKIDAVIYQDNSVSITDNGRGIPVDLHPVTKKSSLETVLTVLHAGGKFGGSSSGYNVSGDFMVGLALEVTVWRDGKEYYQSYSRGKPSTALTCQLLPADEISSRNKDQVLA
ncbi:hypothetical protein HPP92_006304 [Vanilla planifolia]|uniref:Uncharacterized protein n=1 Tax=Vanilla planifolia TaxID=51239 RepID=A0A835REP9_VANPL|nr:hypothetical protein HPP92_006582 [Vanilla planifolia]KAG0489441.1 hypothetical protein HPP92_006304 [Vanilla planifolia]